MGYDCGRFKGEVDEELLCPICTGVLEDPVQAKNCEHSFCRGCIGDWLAKQASCPIDRGELTKRQLSPVPRILKNLLSRLEMHCEYRDGGCLHWLKLDALQSHLRVCDFNPKKLVQCDKGCKLMHLKCESQTHDCVKELRGMLDDTKHKHREMETKLEEVTNRLSSELVTQQQENQVLLDELYTLRGASSASASSSSSSQAGDSNWVRRLTVAKVSRWGGMISTPDPVLQTVTKRALLECGCPLHTANQLILNSHEREWPSGLKTLEARQLKRRMYQMYITKRIPGRQAVVAMAGENEHMSDEFMLKPGLLMVFAQGVE